ncbi:MAG: hypothetical protein LC802_07210 [Acidobacteria bacterium]|nr:hypothetical protein [Acidobacteriota bacterium]
MRKPSALSRKEFRDARARMSVRSIPELIRRLESEDLSDRFLAEMCLRDAAGT